MAARRVKNLTSVMQPNPGLRQEAANISAANCASGSDDPIVITAGCRTAIGRAKKGGLAETPPDLMLATVLNGVLQRSGVDASLVNDVCVGNVLQPGAGALGSRIGALVGGLPVTTAVMTVNRQCSSGLQAFGNIAGSIAAGICDIGIAAGVESMSLNDMMDSLPTDMADSESVADMLGTEFADAAENCLTPMGMTSENVAEKYGITRETQDAFAMESNAKALSAIASGAFAEEIVPVAPDPDEPDEVFETDDGPRVTTLEKLGALRPAFDEDGSTTAGNSSQMSDGAAALLVMRQSKAAELGQTVMGASLTPLPAQRNPRRE